MGTPPSGRYRPRTHHSKRLLHPPTHYTPTLNLGLLHPGTLSLHLLHRPDASRVVRLDIWVVTLPALAAKGGRTTSPAYLDDQEYCLNCRTINFSNIATQTAGTMGPGPYLVAPCPRGL